MGAFFVSSCPFSASALQNLCCGGGAVQLTLPAAAAGEDFQMEEALISHHLHSADPRLVFLPFSGSERALCLLLPATVNPPPLSFEAARLLKNVRVFVRSLCRRRHLQAVLHRRRL